MDEVVQRAQHLLERRVLVDVMHVVEVHVIGLQPPQAVLDGVQDVHARHAGVVGSRSGGIEEFGSDHGTVAPTLERLAENHLGLAPGVGVRGVEEIDAGRERHVDHAFGLSLIGNVAEGHGAKAQLGHLEACASQIAILHRLLLAAGRVVKGTSRCRPQARPALARYSHAHLTLNGARE